MSVGLHKPPVRRRCTGPGGNTRTTPLPSSRVLTLLMHFSPCVRLANHHAIASMMYPTRRGMYPKAREEYSIEGVKAKRGRLQSFMYAFTNQPLIATCTKTFEHLLSSTVFLR